MSLAFPRLLQSLSTGGSGSSYANTETTDWLSRVATAGGTVSGTTATAVDTFISAAKTNSFWTTFRRLNLCCGDFAASFVPVVNTSGGTTDTNVNLVSGDYSESLGWQTDGSTKYVSTGYVPSDSTGGLSVYLRTAAPGTSVAIGARNSDICRILFGSVLGEQVTGIWGGSAGAVYVDPTPVAIVGLTQSSRTSSTSLKLYTAGALRNTNATATTTFAITVPVFILAQNNAGTANAFCPSGTRISAYGIDTGMSDAQASAYYTAMQAFQTSLSRQV